VGESDTQKPLRTSNDGLFPSGPLDVDQDLTLERIERSMPVRLIATFDNLITATTDEPSIDALDKVNKHRFDYLPVRRSIDGPIIGILSADRLRDNSRGHHVDQVFEPLGPSDLISSDTSLLQFVWSADQQPRRLVLEATEIRGIVTLSDIQKLPVRISLFSLFIHFELLLTEHLRQSLRDKNPLEFVTPRRRDGVSKKWKAFIADDLEHDIFSAMDICDKRDVAEKLKILGKSAKSIASSISNIERFLRNPIAHGADYAISKEAAYRTVRAAQETQEWIRDLRSARGLGLSGARQWLKR
jgi:CBS domain-containing protein